MLYIFGGLPGTGKTTLARHIAHQRRAVYLRVDTIEQAIRESVGRVSGPEGYVVAYRLAAENLRLGLDVVADSVNPLHLTRAAWRHVAEAVDVSFMEIEVICSNETEHRMRVETRMTDITSLQLPTWQEVKSRVYEPWDGNHLVIDTAGQTIEQSIAMLQRHMPLR